MATSKTNTNDKSDPGQKIIEELEEINSYLHNVNEVNLTLEWKVFSVFPWN